MNATRSPAAQMLANISPAALARTKRPEIQRLADGGQVRHPAEQKAPRAPQTGAALMLSTLPASHAKAKTMEHGGPIHGPGTPTSDSVPIWASKDEFMLPADTTAAVGKHNLQALVDATHTPTRSPAEKMGRLARADGGPIDPGAVTRVGNSYSGGSVTGNIAVNGAAPGGTVSTIDAYKVPPPPAAPPVLGAPAAVKPLFPQATTPATAGTPAPAPAPAAPGAAAPAPATATPPPPPAPLDYANRNAAFNAGADARTAMMSMPGVRRSNLAAAPAPGSALAALSARPVQSIAGYADGGEIDDPRKPLSTFTSPEAAAQALGSMAANARTDMQRAADVQLASLSPSAAAAEAPKPYVAEIPRGRYESAAPYPDAAAQTPVAPVQPAAAPPVEAQPVAVAQAPAPAPAAAAPIAPTPQAQLATLPATGVAPTPARANPLGSMADTQAQIANIQAANATVPQGGATIIDGAGAEADRRAQFNEQANLRNALNGSVMTRRGAVPNEAAVQAALLPIDARARMAQVAAKEAGDTQRATIQERGTDARAKLADTRAQQELGINQQRLAIEGKKVTLDANRDDRAAAAAEPALALAQRKASLQAVVADPNSTPAQRQAATQQIAGMEGKELLGHAPPAGYERTPDGNLKFIKGGPADPDTPKGKNNLTDTQAKALQFGSRMQEANEIFDKLEKDGKLFSTLGANNPITGGIVNQFNTAAAQQLDQAKRNFVNAVLRRESGAAIAPSEFDSADKQYFPQPGDSAEVVQQKRANRELSMRGILAEVPDAETRLTKIRNPMAAPPAATPQIAELQRRAAGDPAVAARLKQMGY
jgi:hypothetical protein